MKNTSPSNAKKQRFSTDTLKKITLSSYFLLLILMPLWLIILSPEIVSQSLTDLANSNSIDTSKSTMSPLLTFVFFVLPLLLPLKGLLQGKPYTYAWANFIVMIYFLHSLTTFWVSSEDRIWAAIEFILAATMFLAGSYYAKYKSQELKKAADIEPTSAEVEQKK